MSTWFLCLVLVAFPDTPTAASPARNAPPPASVDMPERSLSEIHQQLRGLLQQEAELSDAAKWESAVVQLTQLYGDITHDPRLSSSDVLNGYRIKLRRRLLTVQEQLERERSVSNDSADQSSGVRNAGGRRVASPANGMYPHNNALSRPRDSSTSTAVVTSHAGGAARADYGDDLAELIRRTISPDFWDVKGGPGTIVYYRQWQALVVRATSEVHRRIGGAVEDLRK